MGAITIQDGAATDINFKAGSPTWENSINQRGTATFIVEAGPDVTTYPVDEGEDVFILDAGTKVFGGRVVHIKETDVLMTGRTQRLLSYSCLDFDQIAIRRVVNDSYSAQTAGAIVSDIITNYLDGESVTEGTIEGGPTISKIVYPHMYASVVLDELAALAGFDWEINLNKALQFKPRTATAAAFNLTSSNKDYLDISKSKTTNQYINKQILRGGIDIDTGLTETIAGDGNTRAFLIRKSANNVTLVETNIASAGFTTKTHDTAGESGSDFYWQKGSHTIEQDVGGTVLNAADLIRITFDAEVPVIIESELGSEITARAAVESGSGIYENVFTDQKIDDVDLAIDIAAARLERFGSIHEQVVYTTDTPGLIAGTLQTITLTDMNISGEWLIESVRGFDLDGDARYSVTAVSGQSLGGWQAYYQKLLNPADIISRENEVVYKMKTERETNQLTDTVEAIAPTTFGFSVGAQRTNICLQSQTMDSGTWVKGDASITADQYIAPDGTLTADKWIEAATSAFHLLQQNIATGFVAGTSYCFSAFFKADGRDWIRMDLGSTAWATTLPTFYCDIANGTVDPSPEGGLDEYGIIDYGNGWYRCWFVAQCDATATGRIELYMSNANHSGSYAGDGVSAIGVWGVQVEAVPDANPYPSPYIPTVGSGVAQDWDSMIGMATWG